MTPAIERKHVFLGMPVLLAGSAMEEFLQRVQRLARANAVVLITGETGTGKEWVARALHCFSERRQGPWVDMSCTTLPEHLAESELFGFEKGAFSGAQTGKAGLFELARNGTLFLDEMGDLDLHLQAKLLRVLDGASYYRLGGTRKIEVEARVVAATHRNLERWVERGKFREDLFHRLNQLTIEVPPLRQRRNEIAGLAEYFLEQVRPGCGWSGEALSALERYGWPGNVRELKNTVCRAAWETERSMIGMDSLPAEVREYREESGASLHSLAVRLAEAESLEAEAGRLKLEDAERRMIRAALDRTGGRREDAARLLGISRRTLTRRLKEYGSAA